MKCVGKNLYEMSSFEDTVAKECELTIPLLYNGLISKTLRR
jgi:hypothetical protein